MTFVLQTVARKDGENRCWVPKVEDDEQFAGHFPDVAAFHGVYWMKKKEALLDLF